MVEFEDIDSILGRFQEELAERGYGIVHLIDDAAPEREAVAYACTAYKKGITEQRSLWHGEQGADVWLAHMVSRGCTTTKTPLYSHALQITHRIGAISASAEPADGEVQ